MTKSIELAPAYDLMASTRSQHNECQITARRIYTPAHKKLELSTRPPTVGQLKSKHKFDRNWYLSGNAFNNAVVQKVVQFHNETVPYITGAIYA